MDDLFDILIESGGKETKPAFSIVFGFQPGDYRALRGEPLMAQKFGPASLLVPLVLAIVTKGDVSQALVWYKGYWWLSCIRSGHISSAILDRAWIPQTWAGNSHSKPRVGIGWVSLSQLVVSGGSVWGFPVALVGGRDLPGQALPHPGLPGCSLYRDFCWLQGSVVPSWERTTCGPSLLLTTQRPPILRAGGASVLGAAGACGPAGGLPGEQHRPPASDSRPRWAGAPVPDWWSPQWDAEQLGHPGPPAFTYGHLGIALCSWALR